MLRVEAIGSATSSISASLQELAAAAHNIANLRTAESTDEDAFAGEQVVRTEGADGGVRTSVVPAGTKEGVVLAEPDHPRADAAGNVRYPDIDLAAQLVDVIVAQQNVEANVTSLQRGVDTYRDLLAMTTSDRERLTASSA